MSPSTTSTSVAKAASDSSSSSSPDNTIYIVVRDLPSSSPSPLRAVPLCWVKRVTNVHRAISEYAFAYLERARRTARTAHPDLFPDRPRANEYTPEKWCELLRTIREHRGDPKYAWTQTPVSPLFDDDYTIDTRLVVPPPDESYDPRPLNLNIPGVYIRRGTLTCPIQDDIYDFLFDAAASLASVDTAGRRRLHDVDPGAVNEVEIENVDVFVVHPRVVGASVGTYDRIARFTAYPVQMFVHDAIADYREADNDPIFTNSSIIPTIIDSNMIATTTTKNGNGDDDNGHDGTDASSTSPPKIEYAPAEVE